MATSLPHAPDSAIDSLRDDVRTTVRSGNATGFPLGRALTSASLLLESLLQNDEPVLRSAVHCSLCSRSQREYESASSCIDLAVMSRQQAFRSTQDYLVAHFEDSPCQNHCSQCQSLMMIRRQMCRPPAFISFELHSTGRFAIPVISDTLSYTLEGNVHRWRLVGCLYLGGNHFTSRFLDASGQSWFHDGVATGHSCLKEVVPVNLKIAMGRQLSHLIYMQTD